MRAGKAVLLFQESVSKLLQRRGHCTRHSCMVSFYLSTNSKPLSQPTITSCPHQKRLWGSRRHTSLPSSLSKRTHCVWFGNLGCRALRLVGCKSVPGRFSNNGFLMTEKTWTILFYPWRPTARVNWSNLSCDFFDWYYWGNPACTFKSTPKAPAGVAGNQRQAKKPETGLPAATHMTHHSAKSAYSFFQGRLFTQEVLQWDCARMVFLGLPLLALPPHELAMIQLPLPTQKRMSIQVGLLGNQRNMTTELQIWLNPRRFSIQRS